jgi:hypothetical protein
MLSAATAPTVLSAFFLSMAYKPALWAGLGIVAAFETTVYSKLRQEPARIRLRDAFGVVALSITVIVAIYFYLRMKGID